MGTETELKLRLKDFADAERITAHPLLAQAGTGTRRHLISTYFDTPMRELLALKVGLRIRYEDGRLIQTLKSAGPGVGGLHRRKEWEAEVKTETPDYSRLPAKQRKRIFADPTLAERIRPCFTTDFERTLWYVTGSDGSEVEVCLDLGEIRGGERSLPLHEVELELKQGDPAQLYVLALQLQAEVPLFVEDASKAQRGYELEQPRRPVPSKAESLELTTEMTTEQGFVAILHNCITQVQGNHDAVLDGSDPEGVHQMRVGLRRMRSALSLFRPVVPKAAVKELNDELRWLAGVLGHARDWDVFAMTLDDIIGQAGEDAAALKPLRTQVTAIQRHAYVAAHETLSSVRYSRLLLTLGAWIAQRAWRAEIGPAGNKALERPLLEFADTVLSTQDEHTCKRGRNLGALSEEKRHLVRIESKKQAYAAQFFRSLYPRSKKPAEVYIKTLSALRDELGILNDTAVARELLAEAEAAEDARNFLAGWYAAQKAFKLDSSIQVWDRFLAAKRFWR